MSAVVQALVLGAVVGTVFALARMVPPAPPTWAGVAGIVGIAGAWMLVSRWVS